MKVLLKDLKPGDEFEYVNTARHYRKGKFVVLNSIGSYLEPSAREGSIFIFSFTTNKVCQHWELLDINLISRTEENNVENKMGHFEGWKFGVPVKVSSRNFSLPYLENVQLVYEDKNTFRVVGKGFSKTYAKIVHHYELIPYQQDGNGPVYPVCRGSVNTTYFIESCKQFGGIVNSRIKSAPIATLNIDGKTIELSVETTAELKNKLGI